MRVSLHPAAGLFAGTAVFVRTRPASRSPRQLPAGAALLFSRALTAPSSSSSPSSSFSSSATAAARLPPHPAPLVPTAPILAPSAANPPATTRPPPLVLPEPRRPDDPNSPSTFAHLMATGKAYLAFYKAGLRYLRTNTQLVRQLRASSSAASSSASTSLATTRADLLLRQRWRHDMCRLPVFALLLLVCGEFTPLVVLLVPHVVPYPCRIPQQVDKLQRLTEARRAASFAQLDGATRGEEEAPAHTSAHVVRSLGLVAPLWDRAGLTPPYAGRVAARRLRVLAEDDALLHQSGGAAALEPAEVRLACADRGIDTRGVDDSVLRTLLATWLQRTAEAAASAETAKDATQQPDLPPVLRQRMEALLTRRPEVWPAV